MKQPLDILRELVKHYVANKGTDGEFIACYTFGNVVPDFWRDAILCVDAPETLPAPEDVNAAVLLDENETLWCHLNTLRVELEALLPQAKTVIDFSPLTKDIFEWMDERQSGSPFVPVPPQTPVMRGGTPEPLPPDSAAEYFIDHNNIKRCRCCGQRW